MMLNKLFMNSLQISPLIILKLFDQDSMRRRVKFLDQCDVVEQFVVFPLAEAILGLEDG